MSTNYSTAEQLLAYKSPTPLSEDYTIPETEFTVHIDGLKKYADRVKMFGDIATYTAQVKDGLKLTTNDDQWTPTDQDILAAGWSSVCVSDPKMSIGQWLQFAHEGSHYLQSILVRCLICSRVLEEKDDKTEVVVPHGLDAAKDELSLDPLEQTGDDSASTN